MSNEREEVAEHLMGALISKMENMDESLQLIKAENRQLKRMIDNPVNFFKKAGFIKASTERPHDVMEDGYREDVGQSILKGTDGQSISSPNTNAEFHSMEWDDIHALADQAKSAGSVGNRLGME